MDREPLTNEERVMGLLSETLAQEVDDNGLYVWVGKECLKTLGRTDMGEREFLHMLYVLRVKSFIRFSGNTDLEELRTMRVYLLPKILDYFEDKRRMQIALRREKTHFLLPLLIAVVSAACSVTSVLMSVAPAFLR